MRAKKTACLFLFALFALTAVYTAEAHYLSVVTNSGAAEVGKTHAVALSFTHVLPTGPQYGTKIQISTPAMSMEIKDPEFDVKYLYKDGTSTNFATPV